MADPLPFPQLVAFDAAARHLSFTEAARELNVQQPAISRQIAALEAALDVKLFERTKPRLTLTSDGAGLHQAVADGFDTVRAALRRTRLAGREPPVVVNASIGFTSLYLLPRLAAFQAQNPNIRIQFVTRDQNGGYDLDDADILVTFGFAGLRRLMSRPVLHEELVPICAPGIFPDDAPADLDALLARPLLHLSSPDHVDDWDRYLAETGRRAPTPDPSDQIMSYMVYLLAIENGRGVGLGWRGLFEKSVTDGRLVVAAARRVATGRAYYGNLTQRASDNPAARTVWRWLVSLDATAL